MEITPGISEICGAIIGDGWIQSNEKGLFVTGHMTEDKPYYENYFAPLLTKELGTKIIPRPFEYWSTFGIGIYKQGIIRKFLDLGILKGEKAKKIFIPEIFKKEKKFFIPLIRGVFDTDGSIYFMKDINPNRKSDFHVRPRLRIKSISKKLIEDIQELTSKLGIIHANPKALVHGINRSPAYIFEINQISSIKLWFDIIGTNNPVHQTKFAVWKEFGFVPPKTTLNERNKMLKGLINPKSYYTTHAGVP